MRRLRDERGVAMITVLFVAAVLTVVASAAAFVTVQEFRSSADDRRAGRALSTAEAGIDRMMLWIPSFELPWKEIVLSGCTFGGVQYPTQGPGSTATPVPVITLTGTVGRGETYTATLRPHDPCPTTAVPSPKEQYEMDITSTGSIPTATRVVRQEITISGRDLPVGMSATLIDANGNPTFQGATVLSSGAIQGRNKMAFSGIDPWYEKSDFYSCSANHPAPFTFACVAADADDIGDMPAAAHSADRIYLNAGRAEHPPNPNCTANRGIPALSVWDGDINGGPLSVGCAGQPYGQPPTSRFTAQDLSRLVGTPRLSPEDHVFFKSIAQTSGLYCDFRTNPNNPCTRFNEAINAIETISVGGTINNGHVGPIGNYYLVYVEYAAGSNPFNNVIRWSATNPACSTSNPASNGMAIVIVRNGSFNFRAGGRLTGALFAEDGRVDAAGAYTVEGTVIAKEFRLRGGPTYIMSQCWVDLLPGPFVAVEAGRWTEVDR